MSGIEKGIDHLGRVVIPMKFRKKLGIEHNTKVLVSIKEDVIMITPVDKRCALCGGRIDAEHKLRLCDACVLKVKAEG